MLKKLGYPTFIILCATLFFPGITLAKQMTGSKPTQPKYQLKIIQTTTPSYKLGDLDIKISESRIIKKEANGGPVKDVFLKAQISVENKGKVVDKLSFECMQEQGYVVGLFVPIPQPLSNYFLIVKHGDYDGHLLLIDKSGKINNIDGGSYFLTDDKHYMFSGWEGHTIGRRFTVFDLVGNRVVYKTSKKDSAWFDNITDWYKDEAGYFFTANSTDDKNQKNLKNDWIFTYKFNSNKLLRQPAKDRLKKAKKIQLNFVDDKKSSVLVPMPCVLG